MKQVQFTGSAIAEGAAPAAAEQPWPNPSRAWQAAIVLTLCNAFAFVDRQALALLVEPIKQDLGVSDTAMSLLYGLSFTLFYVSVGLPVAALADRANRRNIIAISVAVWSAMTVACGFARSFPALFMARVGVGAGEAGLSPAGYSLLADYFPKDRLAVAMGLYSTGIYIGGGMALMLGGIVAGVLATTAPIVLPVVGEVRDWQVVFMALGLPGLLLALLVLTVREPPRRGSGGALVKRAGASPRQVLQHIYKHLGAYAGIAIGFSLMIMIGNGTGAWIPAFFERRFGWTSAEIGVRYGVVVTLLGTAGALTGGFVASAIRKRGYARGNLFAALIGFLVLIPLTIGFPLAPSGEVALILIAAMNFFAGFNFGGGYAALQEITPNSMRAQVSAGYMLTVNLIGAGLGPTVVALVTDFVFVDPKRLHEALALTAGIGSPIAVLFLLLAISRYRAALADPALS